MPKWCVACNQEPALPAAYLCPACDDAADFNGRTCAYCGAPTTELEAARGGLCAACDRLNDSDEDEDDLFDDDEEEDWLDDDAD